SLRSGAVVSPHPAATRSTAAQVDRFIPTSVAGSVIPPERTLPLQHSCDRGGATPRRVIALAHAPHVSDLAGMPPRKRRGGNFGTVSLRPAPKGREVDPRALSEVRQLLGDAPRRADLLIEHLHLIQDAYGCLTTPHLTALAREMSLTPAEVFEV